MTSTLAERGRGGISFLFAAGERPDGAAFAAALAGCQAAARIGHEAAQAGRAEVLVNGLSFDVTGLAPAVGEAACTPADCYGFAVPLGPGALEAVRLEPGAHLAGGAMLAPVWRAMLALAAELAVCLPVRAVLWHPAETLIEPRQFSRTTLGWLSGGAFPASGLAVLRPMADGSVVSRGLAHFAGQEVTVRGRSGETAAETLSLCERIVDHLVKTGGLGEVAELVIDGEVLCAEPAQHGNMIWVWRGQGQRAALGAHSAAAQ